MTATVSSQSLPVTRPARESRVVAAARKLRKLVRRSAREARPDTGRLIAELRVSALQKDPVGRPRMF